MNHKLSCLRDIYDRAMLKTDRESWDETVYRAYEITVTVDQSRGTCSQQHKHSWCQLKKVVEQCEPELWMCFKEKHLNGWPHYHGIVWFRSIRGSSAFMKKALNKKIGISTVELSRDGYIDNVKKKYADWFEYISKDIDVTSGEFPNFSYVSNLAEQCKCFDRLHKFFSRVKVETTSQHDPPHSSSETCQKCPKTILHEASSSDCKTC